MMKQTRSFSLAVLVIWGIGLAFRADAANDFLVSPKRVFMDTRQRSAEVLLINSGKVSTTFKIYFVDKKMQEDGRFVVITDPVIEDYPAAGMLRYAPRRVTLAPGKSQSIRVLARRPHDLAEADYTTRMIFEPLPDAKGGNSLESLALKKNQVKVGVVQTFIVSIPVIVRQGKPHAEVHLAQARTVMTSRGPVLEVLVQRTGNASIMGDLIVSAASATRDSPLGLVRSLQVYSNMAQRRVRIPLPKNENAWPDGEWKVRLQMPEDEGGALLAQTKATGKLTKLALR